MYIGGLSCIWKIWQPESVKVLCLHEMLLTVMLHNALLNDAFNGAKETILLWFNNIKII